MLLGEVTNNYKQNEQKRKKPLKCTEVNNILAVKKIIFPEDICTKVESIMHVPT